ncbi:chorismate mutase, partial [Listeria monocytogenes]|nr:chorismate mutase [Listeria monocytogenes]EDO1350832.1 chorismate mutase [Listeria monocytogenes]
KLIVSQSCRLEEDIFKAEVNNK